MCVNFSVRGRISVELGKGYKDVKSMRRQASGRPGGAERITTWRMVKAASTLGHQENRGNSGNECFDIAEL